jgi:hypothetical protein
MSHKKIRFTQITAQTPEKEAAAAARRENKEDEWVQTGS